MLESGGVLSASGMWSTRGDELKEQLYNLYTRSNVVTTDIAHFQLYYSTFCENGNQT